MQRKALIHSNITSYLENTDLCIVTEMFTRPCAILFPKVFEKNIQIMKAILDDTVVDYKIYFANKATKADIFIETAKKQGIGLDVSSFQELHDALILGYEPEHILANGPKDILFLRACLQNNILISVDSIGEIQKILMLDIPSESNIIIRISPPLAIAPSRFGITQEELLQHKDLLIELNKKHRIHGLNFHIDSISLYEKQEMIRFIIQLREKLLDYSIVIQQLGIGGGFGVQYVEVLGGEQGKREYPQGKKVYGIDLLDELLHTPLDDLFTFVQYLKETMTTLHVEPGRILLDQCGICIHNIIDKKEDKIFIDGNMYSLGSIGQEMAHDPVVYTSDKIFSEDKKSYIIYGNLCMEHDKILSRKIELPKNIDIGDMLIFVNTAGYFSDFSDSQPIKHNERKTIIAE